MQDLRRQTVGDIMVTDVIAVKHSDSAYYVLQIFNDYHVSSVPVLSDDGDTVMGFIVERDLLRELGHHLFYDEAQAPDIKQLMTTDVEVVRESDDVYSVLSLFVERGVKKALVVDDSQHLTGILTRRELLKDLEDYVKQNRGFKTSSRIPVRISAKHRESARSLPQAW